MDIQQRKTCAPGVEKQRVIKGLSVVLCARSGSECSARSSLLRLCRAPALEQDVLSSLFVCVGFAEALTDWRSDSLLLRGAALQKELSVLGFIVTEDFLCIASCLKNSPGKSAHIHDFTLIYRKYS